MKGDKMLGAHGRAGERINAYRVLVRKDEGNGPLEDLSVDGRIINCVFKEWDGRTWTRLMAQDRGKSRAVVNTVKHIRVP
jgi:hypothetical protein